MNLPSFLRTVVTAPNGGWFCLAYTKILDDETQTKTSWKEEFFSWPDELPNIINRIHSLGNDFDIYFSAYLFNEPSSIKSNAIIGRTIVADLDEANVLTLQLEPTVLVETSLGRHQGYWILKNQLDTDEHEQLSKRLTYSIPRCDKTGWFLGKKVRVPETYNHKYTTGPQQVKVVRTSAVTYDNDTFENITTTKELFGTIAVKIDEENLDWVDAALTQEIGPQEMLSRVRNSIPTIVARYNLLQVDRSAALWALNMSLFRAGLPRDKVFFIAYHSVNNKFKELRFGGLRELGKDVLRAELATKVQLPDIKAKIRDARKLGNDPVERSDYIAKCVREHLEKLGNFIHCNDDTGWYIREDTGRPIQIAARSDTMAYMLDNLFGINASDREASYITNNLAAVASDLPITGRVAALSHYDHNLRTFIVHTGRKDVLVVRSTGISRETNGYSGIVFPWVVASNTISPNYQSLDTAWENEIFEDCLYNLIDMPAEDAKVVLKIWLLSVLLRDGLSSRPILALFGNPGSGKSTLFRRVYVLLYGREKGLSGVSNENDFDHSMAKDPLVVLDNVDTYARWLPDRMAATVAPTELTKRKLFTDMDTIVLRRQAMLGITAHNPKFGREDVTDRLLLFNFERLEHFKPESPIYERINRLRNALWGAILQDIQKILGTEMPRGGYPQFRIEDFAMFGHWIATALGCEQQFRDGLQFIRANQKSFNIEEDRILVDALDKYLDQKHGFIDAEPAGMLWMALRRWSRDEKSFDKKYTNAVALGRKLWNLLDSLREMYDITWEIRKGAKVWTIQRYPHDQIMHVIEDSAGSGRKGRYTWQESELNN